MMAIFEAEVGGRWGRFLNVRYNKHIFTCIFKSELFQKKMAKTLTL